MFKLIFVITTYIVSINIAFSQTKASEKKLVKMMCTVLSEFSTAPDYVVVNVIKVLNGTAIDTNEICMNSNALFVALCYEHTDWNYRIDCKNLPNLYLTFSADSALRLIPKPEYTKDELEKYSKPLKIAKLIKDIKAGKLTSKYFNVDGNEQTMFAHIMLLYGVRVKKGCLSGNMCFLSYFPDLK
ncbi:MAG: hypothetical protein IPM69_01420 [Ignavibacteria bacterium]|nr:hypothetical protein [Ignavibacteria bacterium]